MEHVERSTARAWWQSVKEGGRYVVGVVIGPRKCGKSTWFAELAADPAEDVVLWKVMGVARAGCPDEVWRDLWRTLAVPVHDDGDDPLEHLELVLGERERGLTLVVDDWHWAVEGRTPSDACYEVLDTLSRWCIDQVRDRRRRTFLGLLLLTSLPDSSDLQYFASAAQRPTFERLSQVVTRSFTTERFPMLSRAEAEALLRERGLPKRKARTVATACGGWLRLLLTAAEVVADHDGPVEAALTEVCEKYLPSLLEESVYHWLRRRPEVRREPAEYLEIQLADGRPPSQFGLPHDFDDRARAAPLIRRALGRTFMFVDTENIGMPFWTHARKDPGAYAPGGVRRDVQERVGSWLRALRTEYDVDADDVSLIGVSPERIVDTVGPATPGHPFWPPPEMRIKHGDSADDYLLIGLIGKIAGRHPLARFVLVTGDMDAPGAHSRLGTLDQITVAAPWTVSKRLRPYFEGTGRLVENGLGPHRPGEGS